jgi:hypothetical protein
MLFEMISIATLIVGIRTNDAALLITSGLFALAAGPFLKKIYIKENIDYLLEQYNKPK